MTRVLLHGSSQEAQKRRDNDSPWCSWHRTRGHSSDECYTLKARDKANQRGQNPVSVVKQTQKERGQPKVKVYNESQTPQKNPVSLVMSYMPAEVGPMSPNEMLSPFVSFQLPGFR